MIESSINNVIIDGKSYIGINDFKVEDLEELLRLATRDVEYYKKFPKKSSAYLGLLIERREKVLIHLGNKCQEKHKNRFTA